jgi:hypothetical protein
MRMISSPDVRTWPTVVTEEAWIVAISCFCEVIVDTRRSRSARF